ncbi:unnamed protein product [Amaranthus hypochondriacus]
MKTLNCSLVFSNLILIIPLILLILLNHSSHVISITPNIENFLQCLSSHPNNDQSHPISNAIYTPKNSTFLNVLHNYIRESRFNTSSTPKPLAIITALAPSHIQASIICSKSNGLKLTIRSGGHDFEGFSYVANVPFVILDMFNLRSINVDIKSETAWVQSGATLGEVYYEIAKYSKVHGFPAGVCTSVGAGGHFSGGGYGNLQRMYGLSVDNIEDALIVDVKGRILNRKSMGEDLFWAIRGGGGASFCVVLSWKIKLVRVPEIVTVFSVSKTLEEGATDVVLQWQKVATTIDRKLFIRVQPMVIEEKGKKTVLVSFIGLYLGQTKTLIPLMNKSFPLLGLKPQESKEMSWIESTLFWYNIQEGSPLEVLLDRTPSPSGSFSSRKSDYVKKPISRLGLETIWNNMINLKFVNATVLLQWNPYGGRMSEISEMATPFPHRAGNLFLFHYITGWEDDRSEITRINVEATRQLHDAMTPFVSKNPREAFLNYRDIDIGNNMNGSLGFAFKYFKANVKRMLLVKAKFDPSNFFSYQQSIPLLPNNHK